MWNSELRQAVNQSVRLQVIEALVSGGTVSISSNRARSDFELAVKAVQVDQENANAWLLDLSVTGNLPPLTALMWRALASNTHPTRSPLSRILAALQAGDAETDDPVGLEHDALGVETPSHLRLAMPINATSSFLTLLATSFTTGPDEIIWQGLPPTTRIPLWFATANQHYRITARLSGAVSHALAHNRIPVIRQLWVEKLDEGEPEDLTLEVQASSPLGEPLLRTAHVEFTSPQLGQPFELVLDMPATSTLLAELDEAVPGQLHFTLTGTNTGTLSCEHNIDVYARNEWSTWLVPESLATFIQPNHPALVSLLHEASDLLEQRTGSGSLEGYQNGSHRAVEIARAIYQALQSRDITYIDPPASFETGQKIRTPKQVIDERLGTCLDLALTYAACLEQVGIDAAVLLYRGHANVGLFTVEQLAGEQPTSEALATDLNTVINLIEAEKLMVLETTALTAANHPTFAQAVERAQLSLIKGESKFEALLNVRLLRTSVRPLPTAAAEQQPAQPYPPGALGHNAAGAHGAADDTDFGAANRRRGGMRGSRQAAHAPTDNSPLRVQRWKTSLLDLSLRNRLLNFREGATTVSLVLPAEALHDFEDMIATGLSFQLVANDELTKIHEERGIRFAEHLSREELENFLFEQRRVFAALKGKEMLTRLRGLKSKARTLEEETGANHLFLTLGELVWTEDGAPEAETKRVLRSPLLLIPARLEGGVRGKPHYKIHIDEGGYAVPNYSLLEKLRVNFGLEIPELMRPPSDDAGVDVNAVLAATRAAIAAEQLPFRVDDASHVALLSFTTFRLWKDMAEYQNELLSSPVVSHLVHAPTEPFTDPAGSGELAFRESELLCPKGADGSQMEAVAWAAAGRSFVLEGPPGTGKSQTITNMIAQLVHNGKTVLFVAEKQPALEVVERRLAEVGLGELCLNMHGKKQSPKEIRGNIKRSINFSAQASDAMWSATQAHMNTALRELSSYPAALHTPNAAGQSVWTAWESTLALGEGPVAPVSRTFITSHSTALDQVRTLLVELPDTCRAVGPTAEHPWRDVSLHDANAIDVAELKGKITNLAAALGRLERFGAGVRPVWDRAQDLQGLEVAAWLLNVAATGHSATSAQLQAAASPEWRPALDHAITLVQQYSAKQVPTRYRYRPEVSNLDLTSLHAQASVAMGKILGRRQLNAIIAQLQGFLQPGQVLQREQVLSDLTQLMADQSEGRQLYDWIRAIPGVTLPATWQLLQPGADAWLKHTRDVVLATRELVRKNPDLQVLLDQLVTNQPDAEVAQAVTDVAQAWQGLATATGMPLTGPRGAGGLVARVNGRLPQWQSDAERDLLALRRWVAMETIFAQLREYGLAELCDEVTSGQLALDDLGLAFERGLATESLRERFEAGGMDRFDAGVHDRAADQYVQRSESLREQMTSWIPSGYLRKASNMRSTPAFGQLRREAEKARSRTSVRSLMEKFGPQVQSVAPCFLMSPDSVARLLNPQTISFDVVILDEASQIKVAEAVGALGRGTSVIVVGDSRQMPPTSIAEVGLADDEEIVETDALPMDEESILSEAVQAGLPQLWLSWHYRSQDESLIAFSNHRYYDGRLASFPSPVVGNPDTGVQFRRVPGVFDRGKSRTNRIEAEAVVAEVVRRLNHPDSAGQTVGVVTFNQQQQRRIEELLLATDDDAVLAAMEEESDPAKRLFVKNLETVQGDERDVILFSLGFSRDPATGRLPLNFGPLNRSGGERRLNVAVTRAKQLVMLFASFEPEDIKTEQTASVGLKDLREYLIMARANSLGSQTSQKHAVEGRDLHREQIAAALAERGLRVQTDYGLSDFTVDIAVGRPGETSWRAAVLLDGPRWAERPTVADRDGFPLSVLGDKMQWPHVVRIWLPAWLAERDAILDSVVEQVMSGPAEESADDASSASHGAGVDAAAGGAGDADATSGFTGGSAFAASVNDARVPQLASATAVASPVAVNESGSAADQVTGTVGAVGAQAAAVANPATPVVDGVARGGATRATVPAASDSSVVNSPKGTASTTVGSSETAAQAPAPSSSAANAGESNASQATSTQPTTNRSASGADGSIDGSRVAPGQSTRSGYTAGTPTSSEAGTTTSAQPSTAGAAATSQPDSETGDAVGASHASLADSSATDTSATARTTSETGGSTANSAQDAVGNDNAAAVDDFDFLLSTTAADAVSGQGSAGASAGGAAQSASPSTDSGIPANSAGPLPITRIPFATEHTDVAGTVEVLDAIDQAWGKGKVRECVLEVIEQYGPIELHRLARVVGRRFGMNRMRANRAEAVTKLVPKSQIRRSKLGAFAWPADEDPLTWRVLRFQQLTADRPISEVPPEEILNAARWCLQNEDVTGGEPLVRATLAQFGQTRLTALAQERITAVIDQAIQAFELRYQGSKLVLADDAVAPAPVTPSGPATPDASSNMEYESVAVGTAPDTDSSFGFESPPPLPGSANSSSEPSAPVVVPPPPQATLTIPAPASVDFDAWQEVVKFADPQVHSLALQLLANGIAPPEVGLEINDGQWSVELGWPDHKIAVVIDTNPARDTWLTTQAWQVIPARAPDAAATLSRSLSRV